MSANLINYLAAGIPVVPLLLGLVNYSRLNADSKWIGLYALFATCVNLYFIFAQTPQASWLFFELYNVVEIIIFFMLLLPKYTSVTIKTIVKITGFAYLGFLLYHLVNGNGRSSFSSGLTMLNCGFYMVWIVLLLQQEYKPNAKLLEKEDPFTWYLLGIALYIPVMLLTYKIALNSDTPRQKVTFYWSIQNVFSIAMYLLFSVGIFKRKSLTRHEVA